MFRNLFGGRAAAPSITSADLKGRLDAGERLYLLDVRSPEEYAGDGHIAGAHLIPLPELTQRLEKLPKDRPIVCVCRSGARSGAAAEQLVRAGFAEVLNLSGGMMGWSGARLPVKRGKG